MFRASVICHHIIAWPTWPCDDVVRSEAELWVTLRVESGWEWNCLNGWVVTVQSGSVGHQHISTILPLPVSENYADSESVIRWHVQAEFYGAFYNESYATCLKFHWCASSLESLELWWKQQQSKLIESNATRLKFHWISAAVSAAVGDQPESK